MSEELEAWGHAGGANGKIIVRCDGGSPIKQVRGAVAKVHGGEVIPEQPAKRNQHKMEKWRKSEDYKGIHKSVDETNGRQSRHQTDGKRRCDAMASP